jgi:hypothetical protein
MNSPTDQLLEGALLGDVVEAMTGHDVVIRRSGSRHTPISGSKDVRCSHSTRAFSNDVLLGTAKVVWEGTPEQYVNLLNGRMKKFLKEHGVRPVNKDYDEDNGVLTRCFTLRTVAGLLNVEEKLFLSQIGALSGSAKSENGTTGPTKYKA